MPLDRCTNQRKNLKWLKSEFSASNTLFCMINKDENFFSNLDRFSALYLNANQLPNISLNSCIFLGKLQAQNQCEKQPQQPTAYFAIDCNKLNFEQLEHINTLGQWQPLRSLGSTINAQDAAILALAKGLVHWHKTHLYCGKCGNLNQLIEAGHARQCTHSECRNMTFPRTDPAVIMLVEHLFEDGIARCLLGRQASWPEGMYSTLAGFVDPGETLEQAVIREVAEESGIQAIEPQYVNSQPWPFPASIMLGFTAQALSKEIDISEDDLQNAQWFSREKLHSFAQRESSEPGYKMSSPDSISYYLIDAWKNKKIGKYEG
jgi:NAD+ diphosphatase